MISYLLTGTCGTGKTWVFKQLISKLGLTVAKQAGLYHWITDGRVSVLGKYTGDMFDGSDRLSMAVMSDNAKVKHEFAGQILLAEGDRFSNETFIKEFNPVVIKITGDGREGRTKRGSQQTERHIKSITTRINNIPAALTVKDSNEALIVLLREINQPSLKPYVPQESLF